MRTIRLLFGIALFGGIGNKVSNGTFVQFGYCGCSREHTLNASDSSARC